ncbi:hypothetical protein D3C87_1693650 [compost metagenome]
MKTPDEQPDTGLNHLIVEHVDIAMHRLVFQGSGIVIVGVVNGDQITCHDLLLQQSGRHSAFLSRGGRAAG